MAKTSASDGGKVNKSEAVRAFLAANPAAESQTIITALGAKGIKISPTMVYYVKSKLKQAKRKARRERVAASSLQSGAANPVEVVLRVKNLARELGGIANLKQLVDLLAD